MNKVIHLIPYDGTGGVEVAARSVKRVTDPDLDFSVQSIYAHVPGYHDREVTFGLRPLIAAFLNIRQQAPDMLIVSLWRASLVGMLVKLLRPRVRLVLMLHNTRNAHWLDKLVTTAASYMAKEWWGDSGATLTSRLQHSPRKTRRVISFVTRRFQPAGRAVAAPAFIFWGRINRQKGIDRAVLLFSRIVKHYREARFVVVGPDGGALNEVRELVRRLDLGGSVSFPGEKSMDEISKLAASASFYLQTSHYEGMAMSVVEAMQLGVVPLVTPVGEIGNYCRHRQNAILVDTDDCAVDDVLQVLADPALYASLRARAVATWVNKPLYAQSMLDACREALACERQIAK